MLCSCFVMEVIVVFVRSREQLCRRLLLFRPPMVTVSRPAGSGGLGSSTVRGEAGSPVTLPCPGLGLTPFVVSLSWWCRGCGPAGGGSPRNLLMYWKVGGRPAAPPALSGRHQAESEPEPESEPQSKSGHPRLRLDDTTFTLRISRTRASDTGDYFCIVNSRQQPKGTVRLQIRGERSRVTDRVGGRMSQTEGLKLD